MSRPVRSKWWLLYLLMAGFLVFFFVGARLILPEGLHHIVEVVILVLFYGLIEMWLRANETGFLGEARHEHHTVIGQLTVDAPPPFTLPTDLDSDAAPRDGVASEES